MHFAAHKGGTLCEEEGESSFDMHKVTCEECKDIARRTRWARLKQAKEEAELAERKKKIAQKKKRRLERFEDTRAHYQSVGQKRP